MHYHDFLLQETEKYCIKTISDSPKVYFKAFEDNSGALELTCITKLQPGTKHVNVLYHHLQLYVRDKSISIFPMDKLNQTVDIFTKPLSQNDFLHHWKQYFKVVSQNTIINKCSTSKLYKYHLWLDHVERGSAIYLDQF